MNAASSTGEGSRRLVPAARAVALAWGLFWTGFGLLSGLGEGSGLAAVLVHVAFPGLAFLAAAVIAWRWPVAGGLLLALAGLAALATYGFARSIPGFVALCLPGLLAGMVFVVSGLSRRRGD